MSAPQVDPARRKEQIKEVARATGANGLRLSERVLAIFSASGLLDDLEHSERPRLTDLRRDCSSAAICLRDQRASGNRLAAPQPCHANTGPRGEVFNRPFAQCWE
jgi:hypothetical protein